MSTCFILIEYHDIVLDLGDPTIRGVFMRLEDAEEAMNNMRPGRYLIEEHDLVWAAPTPDAACSDPECAYRAEIEMGFWVHAEGTSPERGS